MTEKTQPTQQRFALPGPINLQARVGQGSLCVHAADDVTEAVVELAARHARSDIVERTTVELRGRTLTVMTPRQGGVFEMLRSHCALDITITVPTGTAMKITTFTAAVTVTGRSGSVDLSGGAADLALDHVDGDLRLRFGSGSATAQRVTGGVEARSGSGQVRFGAVHGLVRCVCGSGRIEVAECHGPTRFRAGSGGAYLAAVFADVDVVTGSGDLSIGLPAGRAARLDVTTGSGRVDSQLPIVDVPTTKGEPIRVRARAGSGNIQLFRAHGAGS